jgi:hypothetical protein
MVNATQMLMMHLLNAQRKNKNKNKSSTGKANKTPFLNKGLRHIFFDKKKGFFILIMGANKKWERHYIPGLFAYKNSGVRIEPFKR